MLNKTAWHVARLCVRYTCYTGIPIRTPEYNIYVRYVKDTYQAMFARVQILASRLENARSVTIGYLWLKLNPVETISFWSFRRRFQILIQIWLFKREWPKKRRVHPVPASAEKYYHYGSVKFRMCSHSEAKGWISCLGIRSQRPRDSWLPPPSWFLA